MLAKLNFHNLRFVFVVGTEGSGHHLFKSLLKRCETCVHPMRIPHFSLSQTRHAHGLFGSNLSKQMINQILSTFLDHVHKLHSIYPSDKKQTVFINALGGPWTTGENSYPNFGGDCRSLKYPEVRILAEILETNGFDFRVLVLVRNAIDTLLSTSVHRRFESWEKNSEFYADMVERVMLEKQLQRLDKRFMKCLNYDFLPEIDNSLGEFLGVDSKESGYNLQEEMRHFYRDRIKDIEREQEARKFVEEDIEHNFYSFQKANAKLSAFCNSL